jgi:hypothetical protein
LRIGGRWASLQALGALGLGIGSGHGGGGM